MITHNIHFCREIRKIIYRYAFGLKKIMSTMVIFDLMAVDCQKLWNWTPGIAPDKRVYQIFFLISVLKHTLWYSLEAPHWGASNEYPQHMFLLRYKKIINTFWLKKKNNNNKQLIWSYEFHAWIYAKYPRFKILRFLLEIKEFDVIQTLLKLYVLQEVYLVLELIYLGHLLFWHAG